MCAQPAAWLQRLYVKALTNRSVHRHQIEHLNNHYLSVNTLVLILSSICCLLCYVECRKPELISVNSAISEFAEVIDACGQQ
ncbi:hypothetical protein AOLI_G00238100 [Acnodon oligacanthus]